MPADRGAVGRYYEGIVGASQRYLIALTFALAHQGDKAQAIIRRRIKYQIPPPPGGWVAFDGIPRPDANVPKTEIRPNPGEAERQMVGLMDTVTRYRLHQITDPEAPLTDEPLLNDKLVASLSANLALITDQQQAASSMRQLANQLTAAALSLDPPTPIVSKDAKAHPVANPPTTLIKAPGPARCQALRPGRRCRQNGAGKQRRGKRGPDPHEGKPAGGDDHRLQTRSCWITFSN